MLKQFLARFILMREAKHYSRRELFTGFARTQTQVVQEKIVISNTCDNIYGYCESCSDSCQQQAITWLAESKPVVDHEKCTLCKECMISCYISAISIS